MNCNLILFKIIMIVFTLDKIICMLMEKLCLWNYFNELIIMKVIKIILELILKTISSAYKKASFQCVENDEKNLDETSI